jgi:transcriptional regulator with XRE-family HTH domain
MTSTKLSHAEDYKALGRALAQLRRDAGLTQVQAGERIGVRSNFVSEVERGNRGMRWHTLQIVLSVYDVGLRDLAAAIERCGPDSSPDAIDLK